MVFYVIVVLLILLDNKGDFCLIGRLFFFDEIYFRFGKPLRSGQCSNLKQLVGN